MKRLPSAVFLVLSAVLMFMSVHITTDRFQFSNLQVSQEEYDEIRSSRTRTDSELLKSVSFNDMPLFYDELAGRWFYSVSTESPDLDPSVDYTSSETDVKIAFTDDPVPGTTISMLAYKGAEFREYSLAITTLPIIQIECETTDIWKFELPMKFTLLDNHPDSPQPLIISEGTIHKRGNTSDLYPKKPYKISLTMKTAAGEIKENPLPLLGLRLDGDWHLYPAYSDQEKIRNVFSSNLWFNSCADHNNFGLKNGMEYRYVELFLNQQYWGLYAIGYPVDAKQLKVQADSQGHYEEFVFKQKTWGPNNPSYPTIDKFLFLQIDAEESDQRYGYSIMQQFFDYLESGAQDGLDHNDEGNAIDLWLWMKLLQAVDSVGKRGKINNIMYTVKNLDTKRIILYTPWDMDITWGNGFGLNNKIRRDSNDNNLEMTLNPVSMMLERGDSDILEKIKQRYAELRADGWSDPAVDELIDGFEQDIYFSGAYVRDMERWPDGSYQDPSLGLSLFRDYVHKRFESMDAYIANLEINQ